MNKFSLRTKLLGSFVFFSLIIALSSSISSRSLGTLSKDIRHLVTVEIKALEVTSEMELLLNQLTRQIQTFLNPKSTREDRESALKEIAYERELYRALAEEYSALIESEEGRRLMDGFTASVGPWAEVNNEIIAQNAALMNIGILNPTYLLWHLEESKSGYYEELSRVVDAVESGELARRSAGPEESAYGQFISTQDFENPVVSKAIETSKPLHGGFFRAIIQIEDLIVAGDTEGARAMINESLIPTKNGIIDALSKIHSEIAEAETIYIEMLRLYQEEAIGLERETLSLLNKMVESQIANNHEVMEASIEHSNFGQTLNIVAAVLSVSGALVFGYFFGNSLTKRFTRIADQISGASNETRAAASQVSSASTELAEGASEQAASLEETSSAMEEVTSMVAKDAELATQTAERALAADEAVKCGVESMSQLRNGVSSVGDSANELSEAMEGIKDSSASISKIIKTIDEIAFQTNILALNAAVEAARAGEAGAGFAVVADEVRSLAQRAADAARETQNLIEESIVRSDRGVTLNANVNEKLQSVLGLSEIVDGHLETIASDVALVDRSMSELKASVIEQEEGMSQINTGVLQVNEVVQSTAASAEESASASEELSAQAESLGEVVEELNGLIKGQKRSDSTALSMDFA